MEKIIFIIIIYFSLILPSNANIFDLHLWRADLALLQKKYPQALDNYLRVLSSEPHNPRLNYNLGLDYYRLKSFDKAQLSFQRAVDLFKDKRFKEYSLYNLGNSFFEQENYDAAIQAYENALKIDPKDEDARHNLELAYKKKKEEKKKNPSNQNKNQEQNKRENKQNKTKNSEARTENLENLLRQAQEANPRQIKGILSNKKKSTKHLKPW